MPPEDLRILLVGSNSQGTQGKDDILRSIPSTSNANEVQPRLATITYAGTPVKVELWDSVSGNQFPIYYHRHARGAHAFVVVYDITDKTTYYDLPMWLNIIDGWALEKPRILIGNNLHMEVKRAIPLKQVRDFARERKMPYFEISTLADFNIREALLELVRLTYEFNKFELPKPFPVPSLKSMCLRSVGNHMKNIHYVNTLPIPKPLQEQLRSYARGAPEDVGPSASRHAKYAVEKLTIKQRIKRKLRIGRCNMV